MTPATTMQIRELIVRQQGYTSCEIMQALSTSNLCAKKSTVDTLRCDVAATIKALTSSGFSVSRIPAVKAVEAPVASRQSWEDRAKRDAKNAKRRANRAAKNSH